jgi:hypothetical protein
MKADYIAGKIDLDTATVLCKKIINYASVNEIEISTSYLGNGKQMSHSLETNDCEPWPDWDYDRNLEWVWNVALYAAKIVVETSVKEHSQCHQSVMKSEAQRLHAIEGMGISFTGLRDMSIDCSKTDDRCVVSRRTTGTNGKENEFFTVCVFIPVTNCVKNASGQIFADIGNCGTGWKGFSSNVLTLNDFGYDCKPK